ncbi:DNA adenine methylase (plasmid) [Crinalium epipsammum PCC 9333]|uniref:Site-specific DNA-methyltransferase (adenine-specific) n=1 Tax=Crinalium epipsammum PCC 9333 TaxID=1173022 RepID=K9W5C7_9CYAN|nr:DNA adenine methylase [Crinalium epipsammum]AFZ15533.1 DNA adenine methylase [Crinalium epipsammum PCC 9333]
MTIFGNIMNAVNKQLKPFLKWAGGKRQLIPALVSSYLPKKYDINYNSYYEPFVGGGALLFSLQPKKAVINDINTELINCYKVIRDSVDELIDDLKRHENEKNYFYAIREWDRNKDYKHKNLVQRASRIVFLNKTCYNGLFRVNSQGQFNVPFGRYKNPNILDIETLKAVNRYLNQNQIEILNVDFQEAVKDAKEGDFLYFDPPYDPISDSADFTSYDSSGFGKEEQIRLKKTFDDLSSRGCNVLLSNAYTNFILELYSNYNQTKISAIRAINSNSSKRGKVDEILIKNYK